MPHLTRSSEIKVTERVGSRVLPLNVTYELSVGSTRLSMLWREQLLRRALQPLVSNEAQTSVFRFSIYSCHGPGYLSSTSANQATHLLSNVTRVLKQEETASRQHLGSDLDLSKSACQVPRGITRIRRKLASLISEKDSAGEWNRLSYKLESRILTLNPATTLHLAVSFACSSFPEGALLVLKFAIHCGIVLQTSQYECVVNDLARKGRWKQIPLVIELAQEQCTCISKRLRHLHMRSLIELREFGRLDETMDAFLETSDEAERSTYHLLAQGHILNNNPEKVRESLDWMTSAGFPINGDTHAAILSAYRQSFAIDKGVEEAAFRYFNAGNELTDTKLLNSLVGSRMADQDKQGAVQYLKLFDRSYFETIGSKTQSISTQEMTQIKDMSAKSRNAGPPPTIETFRHMLHISGGNDMRVSKKILHVLSTQGLQPDGRLAASYINQAGRAGDLLMALSILSVVCSEKPKSLSSFEKLAGSRLQISPVIWHAFKGLRVDIRIFNAFLKLWLTCRGFAKIHLLLGAMSDMGLQPDEDTICIFMSNFTSSGDLTMKRRLFLYSRISGRSEATHSMSSFNSLLTAAVRDEASILKRGDPRERRRLAASVSSQMLGALSSREAPQVNKSASVATVELSALLRSVRNKKQRGNAKTVTLAMRHSAALNLDLHSAEVILEGANARGLHSSERHYAALVEGHVARGSLLRAEETLERAASTGLVVNVLMHTILISGYAKAREPSQAQRVFDSMLQKGVRPDWTALHNITVAWLLDRNPTRAKEVLLKGWSSVVPYPPSNPEASIGALLQEFKRFRPSSDIGYRMWQPSTRRDRWGSKMILGSVVRNFPKHYDNPGTFENGDR